MHPEQETHGMMWSFKEQRYVPEDEYWDIDGDCRLEHPYFASIVHCPSEVESLEHLAGYEVSQAS